MNRTGLALLALVSLLWLVAGCGAKVSGVRESKDFTYQDVIQGGMAIGGVFSSWEEQSAKVFNRNATNLQLSIQEEREDYRLTPMPEVRNALGREAFERIGAEYAADGILSAEALTALRGALKDRYIVLVRIEHDQIGEPSWSRLAERRGSDGRVMERERIHVERTRVLKVTAHVYDLRSGKSVWNGLVTSEGRSQKEYPIREPSDLQALELLIRAAQGEKLTANQATTAEQFPAPGPPPLFQLLPQAFEAFADRLPDD